MEGPVGIGIHLKSLTCSSGPWNLGSCLRHVASMGLLSTPLLILWLAARSSGLVPQRGLPEDFPDRYPPADVGAPGVVWLLRPIGPHPPGQPRPVTPPIQERRLVPTVIFECPQFRVLTTPAYYIWTLELRNGGWAAFRLRHPPSIAPPGPGGPPATP